MPVKKKVEKDNMKDEKKGNKVPKAFGMKSAKDAKASKDNMKDEKKKGKY